ncbi:MAG: hypothetical protein AAF732_00695 [Pseudomonadota bacterium]
MLELNEWLAAWQVWAIAGLALIIVDVMLDGSGYVLSLGVACFSMSALALIAYLTGTNLIPDWKIAALEFAGFAFLSIFIIRRLRPRNKDGDVNQY